MPPQYITIVSGQALYRPGGPLISIIILDANMPVTLQKKKRAGYPGALITA
jgi:hypothetical protein